jgi:RimJ/RimL family protein N-acetyltransferase
MLYESLSSESKVNYYSIIFGKPRNFTWFFAQFFIILSLTPLKIILNFVGKYLYYIMGVFEEGSLIGFCSLCIHQRYTNLGLNSHLAIAIKDKYQGKGIGTKLLTETIFFSKKNNIYRIYLTVLKSNSKACRLYFKAGFKVVDQIQDNRIIIMEKILHNPSLSRR